MGICCMTQGNQTGSVQQAEGLGGERGHGERGGKSEMYGESNMET